MKKLLLLPVLAGILFGCSCKKNSSSETPVIKPMITEPGEVSGSPVSQAINTNGGSITSTDGRMKVVFPAGALLSEQTITIQPITNKMKTGVGKAYRVTPHMNFEKPVSVTFTYTDDEIISSIPELLGIGYQKDDGQWKSLGAVELDKAGKKITVTTTHFSDLGFFEVSKIYPENARVNKNEELELSILTVLENEKIALPDEDLKEPFLINADRVKSWNYTGEGSLQGNGPKARYKAPSKVPDNNPEAVSVNVILNKPGTYLLVTNITVLSDFRIEYLQVDETEQNAPNYTYPSRLYIYGNFGNDPGAGKRSVKIAPTSNTSNTADLNIVGWTPKLIICDLQTSGSFSAGNVIVSNGTATDSKILNEWVVDLMFEKVQSPGGALTRKAQLTLVLRGDADGFYAADQQPIFSYTNLNTRSKGIINMPLGTYTSQVRGDGCGSYTVKWDAIGPDYIVARKKYSSSGPGLGGEVVHTPDGFKIKLRFETPDIIKSTRTFVPCNGTTQVQTVYEPINLSDYHEQVIELKFISRSTGATILAGALPQKNRTGVASGLYFDAEDVNPDLYYARLTWQTSTPKYQ